MVNYKGIKFKKTIQTITTEKKVDDMALVLLNLCSSKTPLILNLPLLEYQSLQGEAC